MKNHISSYDHQHTKEDGETLPRAEDATDSHDQCRSDRTLQRQYSVVLVQNSGVDLTVEVRVGGRRGPADLLQVEIYTSFLLEMPVHGDGAGYKLRDKIHDVSQGLT